MSVCVHRQPLTVVTAIEKRPTFVRVTLIDFLFLRRPGCLLFSTVQMNGTHIVSVLAHKQSAKSDGWQSYICKYFDSLRNHAKHSKFTIEDAICVSLPPSSCTLGSILERQDVQNAERIESMVARYAKRNKCSIRALPYRENEEFVERIHAYVEQ